MTRQSCLALAACILLSSMASAQGRAAPDSVWRSVALRVYELDAHRQFASATPAAVDSLLAHYSDSVVYEHPCAGAVVRGKAALRAGMLRYLGSVPAAPIPATRRAIRVPEFDARGFVRRIVDYPW